MHNDAIGNLLPFHRSQFPFPRHGNAIILPRKVDIGPVDVRPSKVKLPPQAASHLFFLGPIPIAIVSIGRRPLTSEHSFNFYDERYSGIHDAP
jgi:hypothetical protein